MPRKNVMRMAVIGLDAADTTLIEQWSNQGLLPVFARLRNQGTWVRLKNRGEFPSMTVWPAIFTGTHLGKNGVYFPVQVGKETSKLELVKPEHCGQLPFWAQLSSGSTRSIIVDVPFTYPISRLNALQICNWGSYERYGSFKSEPEETRKLRERVGRYPFGEELCRNAPISPSDFRYVRRKLLAAVPVKGEMIRHLMHNQDWKFFMAVFAETHPAGHYFWGGYEISRASEGPDSTLLDVYRRLDAEIGKIAAGLDEKTLLMIVSGHGMGANHAGWHLIPEVLRRIGMDPSADETHAREKSWLVRLRESIPRRWRDLVSHALPNILRDHLRVHWANANIDWSNDLVFCLPTDAHGLIRVNLKGRDVNGQVNCGSEYEELCRRITCALKDLIDPETGKRVVDEVFLTDHIFPGPERDRLPDLIVSWNDGKEIENVASKEVGTVSGKLPDPRSGNHRSEGFALLYGPGIRKAQESEGHLLDVAPTILSFYGEAVPANLDGRPWAHLLS